MNQTTDLNRYNSTRHRFLRGLGKTVNTLLKLAVCVVFAFPYYWMIITSLKTYAESIMDPPSLFPIKMTLEAYSKVITEMNLWHYVSNTLIITVIIIVLQIITMVPAAYSLAKYEYKGKGLSWAMIMGARMVPTVLTFIPIYIVFAKIRIGNTPFLNTLLPQIIPFATSAFSIFLLRQNFRQIPDELIESARLDGGSEWRIMWKIMLPMSRSTMVTCVLFSFVSHWNAYFWPLVMTNRKEEWPISLAIAALKQLDVGVQWPQVMAGTFLMTLPVLILFIFASKRIIAAMAYRGVK